MIVTIKLNNNVTLLGEMIDDDVEYIRIKDALNITSEIIKNKDGSYYTAYMPILFSPFGMSDVISIRKREVLFYDVASDYYTEYFAIVSAALIQSEIKKQKWVKEFYSGEDEANLQYTDEQKNFTDTNASDTIVVEGNDTVH